MVCAVFEKCCLYFERQTKIMQYVLTFTDKYDIVGHTNILCYNKINIFSEKAPAPKSDSNIKKFTLDDMGGQIHKCRASEILYKIML